MTSTDRPVARRHHTVPKFYLRGFAQGESIATVRLPGQQRFIQSIADATVAKDFYTVEGHEDGADAIEKALSGVEGIAADIFRSIHLGNWPLEADERMTLGYFVALQHARVPVQRRTMDNLAAQMLRLQIGAGGKVNLRRKLEAQGGDVTDDLVEELWQQATQAGGPSVHRSKVAHIQQMVDLSNKTLKYFVGRPWALVKFDRRSLITSDAPIGLVPHPDSEPWQGVGLMTAWGITLPISRKLGLLMSNPQALIDGRIPVERVQAGEADTTQVGTTVMEKFFNESTVANASEWLFHHPQDGRFLPADLPEPNPVTSRMDGAPKDFSGEPWFKPRAER